MIIIFHENHHADYNTSMSKKQQQKTHYILNLEITSHHQNNSLNLRPQK